MSRNPNSRFLLGATDSLIGLALAVGAAVWANEQRIPPGGLGEFLRIRITLLNTSFSIVFAVLWQQCMEALGLYRRSSEFLRPTLMTAAGAGVMTALLALYLEAGRAQGPIPQILITFFIAAFGYQMARAFFTDPRLRGKLSDPERVIIVGSGRRAAKAWRELRVQHHGAKSLLGFVDDRDVTAMAPDIAGRFLGRVEDLPNYFLHNAVDELIIAAPARSCYDLAQRAVSMAEAAGVRVVCLNDLYSLVHDKKLRRRTTIFLELVPKNEAHLFAEAIKRSFDVIVAMVGLMLLAPLFLVIAAAIKLTSPGPVFVVQERYGWRRRRFQMFSFRSMVHDAPHFMTVVGTPDKDFEPIPWVTPVGHFLRRALLGDLPQLWNVMLGDMSLVGPRPMSAQDVSLFNEALLMRRFSVRPGMTGSWHVAASGSLSPDQCVELDFAYIEEWSLGLDLKILARAVPTVLRRSSAV
jgi:lipopolysaccharide/colanic/teichoic acid biosynthesis glycosyltransferase